MARQLASLENRVRQIEEGFSNEIVAEDLIHADLAAMIGRISAEAHTILGTSEACEITESVNLELKALFSITENAGGEIE
jgi:hypothetical protein